MSLSLLLYFSSLTQPFNQHQYEEGIKFKAVRVISAVQNVWGMENLPLLASVHAELTQWLCLSATLGADTAGECSRHSAHQTCCAHTGQFYGPHTTSVYRGRLLRAAGHQEAWPELASAVLYIPGRQSDCPCFLILFQNKTSGCKRNTVTLSAVNREN